MLTLKILAYPQKANKQKTPPPKKTPKRQWFYFLLILIFFKFAKKYSNEIISCWETVVEVEQKAPFSIATTPRYRGGRYSFPWIAPLYSWYIPYIVEVLSKEVSSTILKVFGTTRPRIEHRSPGPLANTLPTGPMSRL